MGQVTKCLLAAWWVLLLTSHVQAWEIGDPAPDFRLRTFSGQQISSSTLSGKPLLLVFWNTWCVNCQRELVELERLEKTFGPQRLNILAINTGINDSERKARDYIHQHAYSFAAGFDQDFAIGQAYQVRGVPTVCLIDSGGIVRYRQASLPDDLATLLGVSVALGKSSE